VPREKGLGFDFLLRKLGKFGGQEGVDVELSVAGTAVDPVKFEFLDKSGASKEAFECAHAHMRSVFKGHVVGDTGGDGVNVIVGKTKATEDLLRHTGSDSLVTKKSDPAIGFRFRGAGLSDIMKKGGEGENGGGIFEVGEQKAGMHPDIALGVVFGGLGAAPHFQKLGKPDGSQARFMEKIEASSGIGAGEDFDEFIPDSFRGDDVGLGSKLNEGFPCCSLDFETQLHRKADGAEESKSIFGKTGERIADGTNRFSDEIFLTLNEVEEFILEGIKKHSVDGEVAPFRVLFGCRECDGGGATSIEVGAIDSKGGDFEYVFFHAKSDDAKCFSLRVGGFGEERLDLVRRGGGGDIHVRVWPL